MPKETGGWPPSEPPATHGPTLSTRDKHEERRVVQNSSHTLAQYIYGGHIPGTIGRRATHVTYAAGSQGVHLYPTHVPGFSLDVSAARTSPKRHLVLSGRQVSGRFGAKFAG